MNRRYIQFVCSAFLVIYLAALAVSFLTQENNQTIFGPNLGADYASFYVAGKIYNEVSPDQIYDRPLHTRLYLLLTHDPDPASINPYAEAPFFVLPYAVLARLPYGSSYLLWMLLAAGLYIAAVRLTWNTTRHLPSDAWPMTLLLSVTFVPFLLESLAGGQPSAFGLFWLAVALFLERRQRRIFSGLALAMCLYKPTLLLLIVPMLLVSRRWRILAGFAIGASALALLSLLTVRWQGLLSYLNLMTFFSGQSAADITGLRTWKYIDLNSFFRLLLGSFPLLRWGALLVTVALVTPMLVGAWRRLGQSPSRQASLLWALTLAWTTVLNIYVGIYDAVLLVPSAILTADVILEARRPPEGGLPIAFKYMLLLLYVTPWFTEFVAFTLHLQVMTVVIAAFGLYLLTLRRPVELEAG